MKCQGLTISRRHKPVWYDYHLHRTLLEDVTLTKYLGLTLQYDIKRNMHTLTTSPQVPTDYSDS